MKVVFFWVLGRQCFFLYLFLFCVCCLSNSWRGIIVIFCFFVSSVLFFFCRWDLNSGGVCCRDVGGGVCCRDGGGMCVVAMVVIWILVACVLRDVVLRYSCVVMVVVLFFSHRFWYWFASMVVLWNSCRWIVSFALRFLVFVLHIFFNESCFLLVSVFCCFTSHGFAPRVCYDDGGVIFSHWIC